MNPDFSLYGYTTNNPPPLHTSWREEKRLGDLSGVSFVFITSLYKTPWRQRERFPNANKSTIKYYSHKYGEKRVKSSMQWVTKGRSSWPNGSFCSKVFGER